MIMITNIINRVYVYTAEKMIVVDKSRNTVYSLEINEIIVIHQPYAVV